MGLSTPRIRHRKARPPITDDSETTMQNLDRRYILAAIALAVVVFIVSLIAFPESGQSLALLLAPSSRVCVRLAFPCGARGAPGRLPPPSKKNTQCHTAMKIGSTGFAGIRPKMNLRATIQRPMNRAESAVYGAFRR